MKPKICVVGSANIDQVSYVKRAPNDGETLFGEDYQMGFGGKGANQAVMAGLLGAEVYVIACLGSDVYREMTIENFKNNNVITDYIQTVEGSSGVAPIWVDESGQNRIVVIPGANNLLDSSLAIESLEKIGRPDVLVGQFEIPMNVNEEVFSYAYKNGVQTVLNPAPANKPTDVLLEIPLGLFLMKWSLKKFMVKYLMKVIYFYLQKILKQILLSLWVKKVVPI